jgi:hypothetical protein
MMTAPGVAFPDASASQVGAFRPHSLIVRTIQTNMQKSAFEQTDLPLEEFYFGDPAAWTFDNLWEIE